MLQAVEAGDSSIGRKISLPSRHWPLNPVLLCHCCKATTLAQNYVTPLRLRFLVLLLVLTRLTLWV